MTSLGFARVLLALVLLLAASVWSFRDPEGTAVWVHGMSIDEGINALKHEIVHALRGKPNAINPTPDSVRDFFNELEQRGRFNPLLGREWNDWFEGWMARKEEEIGRLRREAEREAQANAINEAFNKRRGQQGR
ncbi:conserved hypothetical Ustilaginaceae_specific protein [Sporisorium reilianum SRZ2]|uniref:Conserved hypothetical Ustilaginaceae_specific protein n=1 Tax=Sporisorium reilianum (strain SRZ2) TaxID=999809 RepID=E7A187_SPORE|nr:conserved hypothetical Ustilaginaceae_specific protein [Sporisorium reilianum SRZ2]